MNERLEADFPGDWLRICLLRITWIEITYCVTESDKSKN